MLSDSDLSVQEEGQDSDSDSDSEPAEEVANSLCSCSGLRCIVVCICIRMV